MAGSVSTRIVTDNLVFYLDAANERSYDQLGTTWLDLSRNKKDDSSINFSTFDDSNNGSFIFNGASSYVQTITATDLGIQACAKPFSFSIWFKTTGTGQYYLFDNYNGDQCISVSISNGDLIVYMKGDYVLSGTVPSVTFFSGYNDGNWHNFTMCWNGVDSLDVYMDASFQSNYTLPPKTTSVSTSFESGVPFSLGVAANRIPTGYFDGNIAAALVYTKELSFDEVRQNYNALKKRFL